jgi:nucleotide-binding universal stress UspA family protein
VEKLTSILLIAEGIESGTKILEKTIELARGFGARVELILGESRDTRHFASLCTARGYDEVVLCSLFRSPEPLNDTILRRIFETSPDLVVKALAPGHFADGLHPDDQQFAAACPVPVVFMRERAWRSPVRIGAAVDVSGEHAGLARSIVQTSGLLRRGLDGELDVIYSEREQQDEVMRMARAVKLARLARDFHVDSERMRRIEGPPEKTLPILAAAEDYDVLVFGAHAMLTRNLAAACSGDVVLVKERALNRSREQHDRFRNRAML